MRRLLICVATLVLVSAAAARTEPAYVTSTVNLRSGAGTDKEILAKIPTGSLVTASNCSEWCAVEWQGKEGFVIASALDRSGRAPAPRAARRRAAPPPSAYIEEDEYVEIEPPVVYDVPGPYYYGYGYRPYYYGFGYGYRHGRWGYGGRGGYRGGHRGGRRYR